MEAPLLNSLSRRSPSVSEGTGLSNLARTTSHPGLAKHLPRTGRADGRLRRRVHWRTELFQEVLWRMRKWTIFNRRQAVHREVANEIIVGASVAELNEIFLSVDCVRFWRMFHKDTFDILRTRLGDLGVPARAALLRGLIRTKGVLDRWYTNWVRDIFLETKGEELTLLKNMVDSSGDYHNLYKHIYKDLRLLPQNVNARKAILEHIRSEGLRMRSERQASIYKRPRIKVVSDIDDTLWSSGGHYPAGVDTRFPKGVVYPGVLTLFREIIHDSSSWQRGHRIDELLERSKTLCHTCDAHHLREAAAAAMRTPPIETTPVFRPSNSMTSPCRPHHQSFTGGGSSLTEAGSLRRHSADDAGRWQVSEHSQPSDSAGIATEGVVVSLEARGSEANASFTMRRADSDSAMNTTVDVHEDNSEEVAWCRVPGFIECHLASQSDTLNDIRSKVAHTLMLPERTIGQIHVDFSEMDQHFNTDCSLIFLSARPGIPRTRGFLERTVYDRFADLYRNNQLFTMPTLIPGSLSAGLKAVGIQIREAFRSRIPLSSVTSAWTPVGLQKMIAFRNIAALYPEYDFVFFGDNGQADKYLCDRLLWESPVEDTADVVLEGPEESQRPSDCPASRSSLAQSSVLVAFIHGVHDDKMTLRSDYLSPSRDGCFRCQRRVRGFETYIGAAAQAAEEGILSLRGLHTVGNEAIEDFYRLLGRSVVHKKFATWCKKKAGPMRDALNSDIEAANELLPEELQLPPIMTVIEWKRVLRLDSIQRRGGSFHPPRSTASSSPSRLHTPGSPQTASSTDGSSLP